MAYEGWFRFGGNEVVNNERARGIASTVECPMTWLKGPRCTSLSDALGDLDYTAANLPDAPWFDSSLPDVSGRFYGVFALGAAGLNDSTRSASVLESIDDGATIGRTRKSARQVRVRAMLLAKGRDALDYGVSWLNAALDPDACGQHGTGCGTTDLEYLTDCPPARGEVPDFTPWSDPVTNEATKPSFESGSGTVEVRRNLIPSPDTSSVGGWTGTAGAGTLTTEGGRLKLTSDGVNASRLGGVINLVDEKAAGTYAASFKAEALSTNLVGVRVYLYHSTTGNLYQKSLPIVAGSTKYEFTITAAAAFNRVYMEFYGSAIASGDIGYITEPMLESGSIHRAFFRPGVASPDPDLTASWVGTANVSESILTGVGVTGVTSPYSGARGFQSSQWASSGTKSLRIRSIGTPSGAAVVFPFSFAAGKTYTILAKARLTEALTGTHESLSRRIRIGSPSLGFVASDAAPNTAGEHLVSWTVTPTGAYDTLQLWHGGSVGSPDIWWDDLLIVEGTYDGPYFDGSTESTDLVRHAWLGAVDASASTRETRQAFMRPRTDEEYAELVDPYRRFLHNVSVTSGPLERELMNKGEFWGQIFEWTYTAGRPWVYSVTREVALPVTPTVVIQDTPYNLVPYPSAEVAGANVDAAVNYSTNPSVEANATGWAPGADGVNVTSAMLTFGRVTGELAAVGTSSYRVVFTASGAGANGYFYAQQEVDLSARPAGSRVSINFWAAELLMSGTPVRPDIEIVAYWRASAGGAVLRTDVLGTVPVNGGALSVKSIAPPAGANFVLVRAKALLTSWPAGTVVRLYADALAVTVP